MMRFTVLTVIVLLTLLLSGWLIYCGAMTASNISDSQYLSAFLHGMTVMICGSGLLVFLLYIYRKFRQPKQDVVVPVSQWRILGRCILYTTLIGTIPALNNGLEAIGELDLGVIPIFAYCKTMLSAFGSGFFVYLVYLIFPHWIDSNEDLSLGLFDFDFFD